jgi:hypothetical protein
MSMQVASESFPRFGRCMLLQYPSPLCRLKWVVIHVIGLHVKLTILGEYDVASMTIVGIPISALGRMANLKTRRQARVKELAKLKLQALVLA